MKENKSSSWIFEKDKINQYAWWNNFLNKEECKKIILIGNKYKLHEGTISNTRQENLAVRNSKINFLYPGNETQWLFQRLTDVIKDLNNKYFNFDIIGFTEGIQFSKYKAPKGGYIKHVDSGYGFQVRKLSISIQLSDSKSYEGGDVSIYNGEKGVKLSREQGSLSVFPSYTLHDVSRLTKGERYSLVCWINGPQFK